MSLLKDIETFFGLIERAPEEIAEVAPEITTRATEAATEIQDGGQAITGAVQSAEGVADRLVALLKLHGVSEAESVASEIVATLNLGGVTQAAKVAEAGAGGDLAAG